MGMSHVQPLLLLIASLFFLPFSRAIDFKYCNNVGYDLGTVTGLEIYPDPIGPSDVVRFRVSLSFTTSSTIKSISPTGTIDASLIYENTSVLLASSLFCSAGECPLESKDYVLSLTITHPSIFQSPKYIISLNDRVGDIGDPEKLCVAFDLPT